MSIDARAIVFGVRSLDELAAAVRASGLVEDLEVHRGDHPVVGRLLFVRSAERSVRRVAWVFDGSTSDDRDVYAGERTLISMGADGGGEILEAALKPFGGYLCRSENVGEWRPVDAGAVEFCPQDRFRIAMAKMVSPREAEILFALADDPAKRQALISALEGYEAAMAPQPSPGR